MDFFPPKKQTEEYLKSVFVDKGLAEVVKLHKAQASQEAKRELTQVRYSYPVHCRMFDVQHFRKEFYRIICSGNFFKKFSFLSFRVRE